MENYSAPSDDAFTEFLDNEKKAAEEKARQKAGKKSYNYEQVKYVGLSKEKPAIVRFVGGLPSDTKSYHRVGTDAKEINVAKIKADDKGIMYLYLPLREDDPDQDHLMWKVIDAVMKREWINKKPVCVNEVNNPEIFKIVNKGGYTEDDGKWPYMYATGWKGKQVYLINCLDRCDSWCKDNKHTKVLSKSVNVTVDKEGKEVEYAEIGVPSYGFSNGLYDLLGKHGSWEKYDCVISRTGEKTSPNKIMNGTAFTSDAAITAGLDKELGLTAEDEKLISHEACLSNEELGYERYDLDKDFKVSSYFTINKRLGKSIKKIDAALGTTFYDKLQELVDEEKKTWDEEKANAPAEETAKVTESVTSTSAAVVDTLTPSATRRVPPVAAAEKELLTPEKIALLKGWDSLSAEEKGYIKDVVVKADGTLDHIYYTNDAPALLDCPTSEGGCGQLSPNSFTACPVCGKKFATN